MLGLRRFSLFVDLDGVLADFDNHFLDVHGQFFRDYRDEVAWDKLIAIPNFWLDLPLMPDAKMLWEELTRHHIPIVILSSPGTHDEFRARIQKRQWVDYHFGTYVPIVFRQRKFKQLFAAPDCVLIDDMENTISEWNDQGGVGIHHVSAADTLRKLRVYLESQVP